MSDDLAPVASHDPVEEYLPCPLCGNLTGSLKQYRYVHRVVYFLFGAMYQASCCRACPSCMRGYVLDRMRANVLTAHLMWLLLLVPWGLVLIARTYTQGHSRGVLQRVSPVQVILREAAAQDVNWPRVWAIVGMLFAAAPILGLGVALVLWLLTRRRTDWTRPAGKWVLRVSLIAQVGWVLYAVLCLP